MKKMTSKLLMLGLLMAQSLTPVRLVFAETPGNFAPNNYQVEQSTAETKSYNDKEQSVIESSHQGETATTSETKLPINPLLPTLPSVSTEKKGQSATAAATITDELLNSMTIASMADEEYSQTEPNRIKNSAPVMVTLDFDVENPGYLAGSTYTVQLPAELGYTDTDGKVSGVDADWTLGAENKTITVVFNQRVSDVKFQFKIKSYLYSDNHHTVTVNTPGKVKNKYIFNLFEEIEAIQYEERTDEFGLHGTVYYNMNRELSGQQTLELLMTEAKGAQFQKQGAQEIKVTAYDVNINGKILKETAQQLVQGMDYTISANTVNQTTVVISNMDQHKAYALTFERTVALAEVSQSDYLFDERYPTTKIGTFRLNGETAVLGNLAFTAKTSQEQKVIKELSVGNFLEGGFQSKGSYNLTIYNVPTLTKAGEKIVIESQNGQALTLESVLARNTANKTVQVTDYFDIQETGNKITFTAKQETILKLFLTLNSIDFDEKDIKIAVHSPITKSDERILLVADQYINPISIIYPNNAETAWGNYEQNGSYSNRTKVLVQGNEKEPVKHLEILVKCPKYLTLRVPTSISTYYELERDYTVTKTSEGTVIKFTTPIKRSLEIPVGFNYVPDGLANNESIPIDTIPITMKADNCQPVTETITTNSKLYSEATLQSEKNQFLVNARNDSFDSLVVTMQLPLDTELDFNIYDVSNDKVKNMYPQFWGRGYHFNERLTPESAGYPTITFNEQNNSCTFDFGKTSKRYLIVYTYKNGWIDTKSAYVVGKVAEPLENNQQISKNVVVTNESLDILQASLTEYLSLKNVTVGSVRTKHIDNQTYKIKNPVFEINTKGTTNAGIDQNSIAIKGVPKDVYRIEPTATGIKVIFDNYTLTENLTVNFKAISENAGEIYTETTIHSESLTETSENSKSITSRKVTLQFAAGSAEGVVALSKLNFYAYVATDKTQPVGNVRFVLIDKATGDRTEFTTNETGNYVFEEVMTGNYQLKITEVPEGYKIPDIYRSGKDITVSKGENSFEIPLPTPEDKTSITVKDSTIYVGTTWQAQDNFVAATDSNGRSRDFSEVEVKGNVNNQQVGDYPIVYRNHYATATATVHVIAEQKTLVVKDSVLYVGDLWSVADNFVSATDAAGQQLSIADLTTAGTVDTTKTGTYQITYRNDNLEETATITVKPDLATLIVKDSSINVGESWSAQDNFVSATNRDGQDLKFENLVISGTVDNQTAGTYQVHYQLTLPAHVDQRKAKFTATKTLSAVANITLRESTEADSSSEPMEDIEDTTEPSQAVDPESTPEPSNGGEAESTTKSSDIGETDTTTAEEGASDSSITKTETSATDSSATKTEASVPASETNDSTCQAKVESAPKISTNPNVQHSTQAQYPKTGTQNNPYWLLASIIIMGSGITGLLKLKGKRRN